MEIDEIERLLNSQRALALAPKNYSPPYIWVNIDKRKIWLTTDNEDYEGDVVDKILLPLGKTYGLDRYRIRMHHLQNGDDIKVIGDMDICFEVPLTEADRIPEIVSYIQRKIYPKVKEWQAKKTPTDYPWAEETWEYP